MARKDDDCGWVELFEVGRSTSDAILTSGCGLHDCRVEGVCVKGSRLNESRRINEGKLARLIFREARLCWVVAAAMWQAREEEARRVLHAAKQGLDRAGGPKGVEKWLVKLGLTKPDAKMRKKWAKQKDDRQELVGKARAEVLLLKKLRLEAEIARFQKIAAELSKKPASTALVRVCKDRIKTARKALGGPKKSGS